MKERSVVFTPKEVRATLEKRKTQFRRPVKPQPPDYVESAWNIESGKYDFWAVNGSMEVKCPYATYGIENELWVRETCNISINKDAVAYSEGGGRLSPTAQKNSEIWAREWKTCQSNHMPRWASRLQLVVTSVRVEQVQDIGEEDAKAEGIWVDNLHDIKSFLHPHKEYFKTLWDSIYLKKNLCWGDNPWVWVVEFEVKK